VTVVEMGPQILPHEDAQIAELVTGYLRDEGIRVMTSARALAVRCAQGKKTVEIEVGELRETLEVEEILVATGRAAAVGDLDLESAGVEYTQKAIKTDEFLRTNQPHIWTAGDCAGGYLFTHVASHEGKLAAENMFADTPKPYNPRVVPRATFVDPEVASIGYTESAALKMGLDVATQSFSFSDLDRALLYGDARGMVKLVIEAPTGQIVGAHIVGPNASSVIQEVVLAMQHHLPVSAIAETMHAYPSFPEAVEAAALSTPSYVGKVEGEAK
jgi:dihydrolipoamide dehydrogenase